MASKKPTRVKAKKTTSRSKAPKKAAPLVATDRLRPRFIDSTRKRLPTID